MMQGDFALDPIQFQSGVTRVLMQQGRVLLPSDWNAQVAVMTEQLRTLARDLIGQHGGPADNLGFLIAKNPDGRLRILPGRYWVDGIPVESSRDDGHPLTDQPYYQTQEPSGSQLLYLEVREIHVSGAEDPSIVEIGLGGPDTTSRARVIWQVRALEWADGKLNSNATTAREAFAALTRRVRPQLTAVARRDEDDDAACTISPDASYRGAENQLYRVEIHGQDPVTFKWSRDNGSIVFPVESVAGKVVHLRALGRDPRTSLSRGQWVEIVDDSTVYNDLARPLIKVKSVSPSALTVEFETDAPFNTNASKHAILRRWDSGLLNFPSSGTAELEHGISISFKGPANAVYRTGDYWLIPARTISGDVIWPKDPAAPHDPIPREPDGPARHLAPLAYLKTNGALLDLRLKFAAAAV